MQPLALPLLVTRIRTLNANDSAALDYLALVTDFFDAGSNLHDSLASISELFRNLTPAGIHRRQFDFDRRTADEPDYRVPRSSREPCANLATIGEAHSEHAAR